MQYICAVHCLFEHNHLARCRQTGRQRSPNGRQISPVVRVGRQLPANVSPNSRQFSRDNSQRMQIVSPNVGEMSPNGRQMFANFRQLCELVANVVRVGRQLRETRERHLSIVLK